MGVYIKGTEMPEKCDKCPLWNCKHDNMGYYPIPEDCPMISVSPHGRLGDLDALEETIEALIEKHLHGYTKSTWDFVCELRSIISNAPTIIPGEKADCHTSDTVTGSQ